MLKLENVTVKYNNFIALNSINLQIKEGEIFTLLGPSGCGKTTLLRAIAGYEKILNGKLIISNKDMTKVEPDARSIGIIFQNYALFPTMNVYKNIAFGLKMKNMNKNIIDEKVKEIAAKIGITQCLEKMTYELSGGEQQRVAIARMLILNPKILLLDEPFSNLDKLLRIELIAEIKKLNKELGVTILYVTHDQEEALTISDRIALINRGKIEQIDTPENLYNYPETTFVATFLGGINSLSKEIMEKINQQCNKKYNLNNKHFIRNEYINIIKNPKEKIVEPCFNVLITDIEFRGIYSKFKFELMDSNITGSDFKSDNKIKKNENLKINIPIEHIISIKE